MPVPNIQLEDLLALAETLRGAGFAVGTQQYIAAHELLIALAARGQLPEDPNKWRTLLGPIFCSSRRERKEFAVHFAAWLAQRPALQKAVEAAQPASSSETKPQATVRRLAFRRWLAALRPENLKAGFRALWRAFKRPAVWGSGAALVGRVMRSPVRVPAKLVVPSSEGRPRAIITTSSLGRPPAVVL